MQLLKYSLQVLIGATNPPGLREAACSCLVTGLEERLPLPSGAPLAIWHWVREQRRTVGPHQLGEVYDDKVFDSVVQGLRDPGAGFAVRYAAAEVLSGSAYAPLVTEELITDLVERGHIEPATLAGLIGEVHQARGVDGDLLRNIRDRWMASASADTRDAGVHVGGLIAKPERAFWTRALADPSESVRITAIRHVKRDGRTPFAMRAIQDRLELEQVNDVRAELCQAVSDLVFREPSSLPG